MHALFTPKAPDRQIVPRIGLLEKHNTFCCCCFCYLTSHVLQLRSETVVVRRRMIYGLGDNLYDGHMITGEECGPYFLTFVLQLRENSGKT